MEETASRYVFRASAAPLVEVAAGLQCKEAHMLGGMVVRYQERGPQSVAHDWCETGHTAFIISGRLRYEFADHSVELGPGDIAHIPAGPAHRHRPHVEGGEVVRYFITEFN
jgi:mannose-6-phosphate isomerase-like protein (cupin superfamily)